MRHSALLSVDRFGRVVLPKAVRSRLGLCAGSSVRLELCDEGVWLAPNADVEPLAKKREVLVFTGTAQGDLESAVDEHRARRIGAVTRRGPTKP